MSAPRTDHKKRKLRKGEGQRPNGLYFYRYRKPHVSKWSYVYASTLQDLRAKERAIEQAAEHNIPYKGCRLTVGELLDQYIGLKKALAEHSRRAYSTSINRIKETTLGKKSITSVKMSDAKKLFVDMYEQGYKYNTINIAKTVLYPAFQMAVDDELIWKNPFQFDLSKIIPKDESKRNALTPEQENAFLGYELRYTWKSTQRRGRTATLKAADDISSYYNQMIILLGTGMRVSELCGLTLDDIDFENNVIYINKQLCRSVNKLYYICPPKSSSGNRAIPMSQQVKTAFKTVLKKREGNECTITVDGYSNFIFLTPKLHPQVAYNLQEHMKCLNRWIKKYEDPNFPRVTPHILRHTFCSRMQNKMDLKCLQYIMGHAKADITLDVYSHVTIDEVKQSFARAMEIS